MTTTYSEELERIANALECIASSLEAATNRPEAMAMANIVVDGGEIGDLTEATAMAIDAGLRKLAQRRGRT
jgi:hypothetical protein